MPSPIPSAQRVLMPRSGAPLGRGTRAAASLKTSPSEPASPPCRASDRHDARLALSTSGAYLARSAPRGVQVGDMSPTRGVTHFRTLDRVVAVGEPARPSLPCPHAVLAPPRSCRAGSRASWRARERPRALLRSLMERRVEKVVEPLRGPLDICDVVNEPLAVLGRRLGHGERALLGAQPLLPHARRALHRPRSAGRTGPTRAELLPQRADLEPGARRPEADDLLALVRRLKRRGVPIDGVGPQTSGCSASSRPGTRRPRPRSRATWGAGAARREVEITELDVALPLVPGPNRLAPGRALQAAWPPRAGASARAPA